MTSGFHFRASRAVPVCAAALVAAQAGATPPRPDHVVIVVEENHADSQIIGNPDAPYINSLATGGALLSGSYALTHPSQANYIHLFSGAHQGVVDDTVPAAGAPFSTPNLGAELIARGFSFAGYSEDLPAVGSLVSSSNSLYVRKHNPWVNWQNSPHGPNQLPPSTNLPFDGYFPADFSQLPTVCFVIPNQQNDMHDGTIAQGDAWLATNIGPYVQWAMTHNSLLILTFDEDESAERNRIATIFYGPMVRPGPVDGVWTHHNVLRTICDMYGLTPPAASAITPSVVGAFVTDPPTATRTFQQGVAVYSGTHDTYIEQASPATAHGSATINVADGSPLSQCLVKFDTIFGAGAGQVPPGAFVLAAKAMFLTGSTSGDNSASTMSLHRCSTTFAWSDSSTWNSVVGGVSLDNTEAASAPDFSLLANALDTWAIFDVTEAARAWSADPAANHGWVVNPGGTDGWRWRSAEYPAAADRPVLSVTYLSCYANCDGSTQPPVLNVNDFTCFLQKYLGLHPYANCDGSVAVPVLNVNDFTCFLQRYTAGCL